MFEEVGMNIQIEYFFCLQYFFSVSLPKLLISFLKLGHVKETSGSVDESSALLYCALKSRVVSWVLQGYHYIELHTLHGFCFSSVFIPDYQYYVAAPSFATYLGY